MLPNTGFLLRDVSKLLFCEDEGTTSQLMLPNTSFLFRNVSNLLFCEDEGTTSRFMFPEKRTQFQAEALCEDMGIDF